MKLFTLFQDLLWLIMALVLLKSLLWLWFRSGRLKIFNIPFLNRIAYLIFTKESIQTSSIKAPNRAPLFPSHCLHILTPFINFLFILDLIICLLNLIFFFTYIYFPNNKKPREKYIEYVYGKFLVFLTWERRKAKFLRRHGTHKLF